MNAKSLLPLLGLTSLFAVACGVGDRSLDSSIAGQDSCPAGETCSASTPKGLNFSRVKQGDSFSPAPIAIARGGYEDVRISRADGLHYDRVFDAKTTDSVLSASGLGSDTVRVTGDHAGSAYLRIVDHGTDALEDRISLEVRDVARVDIRVPGTMLPPGTGAVAILPGVSSYGTPYAAPLAADGATLADDGLVTTWEPMLTTATASDGTKASLTFVIVDKTDAISFFALAGASMPATVAVDDPALVCGVALSGGKPIVGAKLALSSSDNVQVMPVGEANCFAVLGMAVGPATVTVSSGGVTSSFAIDVAAKKQTKSVHEGVVVTGRGERAAAVVSVE
jgi:hypothetical protein